MRQTLSRGALGCATLCMLVATWSSAGPPVVGPEDLARQVLAANPSLVALGHRLEAAQEEANAADASPGPMTELMLQNVGLDQLTVGDVDMSMLGVEIRQVLPGSHKLAARRDAAQAGTALVTAEATQLRRALLLEIRTAWAQLYALDAERRLLAATGELIELVGQVAATRLATGDDDLTAAVRARLEQARLVEREIDVDAARTLLVARLERLLDDPAGLTIAPIATLPPVDFPPDGWQAEAIRESASVAAARAAIEASERRLDSSRQELRPEYTVGGGLGYRGSLDPIVTARFGVSWPAWSSETLRPRVRAAERDLDAARADLKAAELETRAAAARADALRRQAEAQIVRVREGSLPLASAALNAARAAYSAGRGDFSSVVEEIDEWLEVQVLLARREADRYAAWAAVRELVPGSYDRELLGETP